MWKIKSEPRDDLNVKSDWQLINFEIYLHLNWKVLSGNVSRKFANVGNKIFVVDSQRSHMNAFAAERAKSMNNFESLVDSLNWQFVEMLSSRQ